MNDGGSEKKLYIEKCAGHVDTTEWEEYAVAINDKIRKLVANATDLIQPIDSFFISKIKDVWRAAWDKNKI